MEFENIEQIAPDSEQKSFALYQIFTEDSIIYDCETAKSFDKIKISRPLSFSISFLKGQHKLDESFKKFEEINYIIQNLNDYYILGIRSDLYSLGFDFESFKIFISSPSKHQLIKEKINSLIHKPKSESPLSRKDEIEILEGFFT